MEQAILSAFAAADRAARSCRIEILVTQIPKLAQAQARTVEEREEQAMFRIRRQVEHACDLLARQELRELLRLLHARNVSKKLPLEDKPIEHLDGVVRKVDGGGGATLRGEEQQPVLDVFFLRVTGLFWQPTQELPDMIRVRTSRTRTVVAQTQFSFQFLKRFHPAPQHIYA